ncbi:hypothetical protein [Spirosoma pomorum]
MSLLDKLVIQVDLLQPGRPLKSNHIDSKGFSALLRYSPSQDHKRFVVLIHDLVRVAVGFDPIIAPLSITFFPGKLIGQGVCFLHLCVDTPLPEQMSSVRTALRNRPGFSQQRTYD